MKYFWRALFYCFEYPAGWLQDVANWIYRKYLRAHARRAESNDHA